MVEKKHMNTALKGWLEKQKIPRFQILNMAFVPRQSYDDICNGKRSLPTLYRLYLVTGLDVFKLTDNEQDEYQNLLKKDDRVAFDERVAKYFLQIFKDTNELPDERYQLLSSSCDTRNSKKDLRKRIEKEIFKKDIILKKESSALMEGTSLQKLHQELIVVLSGDVVGILNYRKTHDTDLKSVHALITAAFDPDPKTALEKLNEFTKKIK